MTPIGRPRGQERDVEPAAGAEAPGRLLVDLGIVEERVDPLGAAALSTRPLFEPARSSCIPTISAAPRRRRPRSGASPSPAGSAIVTSRAPISSRRRRAISSSRRASSISLASAVPTSFSASSWRRPRGRRLVEARVLDRDRGLARKRLDELLVVGGESRRPASRSGRGCRRQRRAAGSARRGSRASADGWAGSRPSADRRRSLEPQRAASRDQRAEDAAPARKVAEVEVKRRGDGHTADRIDATGRRCARRGARTRAVTLSPEVP